MINTFTLKKGSVPLLISMPHNGQQIPDSISASMNESAKRVPDTDWYMDKLYDFAERLGAYLLIPKFSRYVIDLNRGTEGINLYPGSNSTELCPTTAFDLSKLYLTGHEPDEDEINHRITQYWQPYHQALRATLADLKNEFGQAVLLDAHSILSEVPRFFEGKLPDFNFGNADGKSCNEELLAQVNQLALQPFSTISNGRFKGGFITREYGEPDNHIHALQLELSQSTYMNELTFEYDETKAAQVKPKLEMLVQCLIDFSLKSK